MKEIILNFIKLFIEKRWTLIISFVLSVFVISIIPKDTIEVLPFESQKVIWAWAVCFSSIFLLISVVVTSVNKIKKKVSTTIYEKREREQEEKEEMKVIWNYIDRLSEAERKDIMTWIKTNNKPIPKLRIDYSSNLYNIVDIIEKHTMIEQEVIDGQTGNRRMIKINYPYLYKLKDEVFEDIKYSYKKYGKICNFE